MSDTLLEYYNYTLRNILRDESTFIKLEDVNIYEFYNSDYDVNIIMMKGKNNEIEIMDNTHFNIVGKLSLTFEQTMQHIIQTLCIASFDKHNDGYNPSINTNPPHESKI